MLIRFNFVMLRDQLLCGTGTRPKSADAQSEVWWEATEADWLWLRDKHETMKRIVPTKLGGMEGSFVGYKITRLEGLQWFRRESQCFHLNISSTFPALSFCLSSANQADSSPFCCLCFPYSWSRNATARVRSRGSTQRLLKNTNHG